MKTSSSSVFGNLIWKFAERILAQGISFIVSIVLARLLLPEEYGVVAMILVFIMIANVFVESGFSSGLIQKKNADELDFSSIFYFNLGLSVLLYFILFFASPYIANYYGMASISPILRVLGIRIIITSLNSVQHAYVSRHMVFRKYFWSTLFGTLISGGIGIVLAYRGFGAWALVAQYLTNTTVDTIVLLFTIEWKPKLFFSICRVKSLVSYSWKIMVESLAETITQQVRNLVIGKVYSSDDLAYYSKGQQLPSIVVNNISSSVSSVLFPAMSNLQDNEDQLIYLLRKSVKVTSFLVFPMLLGLGIVGKPLITVLLTDKWIKTVPYLYMFCFISAAQVGLYPRHQALKAIGRSDVFMYEHMIYRVISLVLLCVVYKIGVLYVAISAAVGATVLVFITAFTSKKYNNYSYKEQIQDVSHGVICCLVMGMIISLIGLFDLPSLLLLVIQVLVGLAVYFITAKMLGFDELKIIIQFLCILRKREDKV